jgi:hypothetical protein
MASSEDGSGSGVPAARVSQADRDPVVQALTRLYTEDRLSDDELETRLDRVYRAATLPELRSVVADLDAPVEPAKATPPVVRRPSVPEARVPRRFVAVLSGREQMVTGVVPGRVRVRSLAGYVSLDLTRATFEPGVTEIRVRALAGAVELHLPANVRVECDGRGIFGYFSVKGSGSEDPDCRTVVRIRGRAVCSHVECQIRQGDAAAARVGPGDDE